ncbi:MAG: hypothetical protein K9M07_07615 [Simkaniaceae bacterium]|nr:hypothetical protein [Simkaniaceae bacterium]
MIKGVKKALIELRSFSHIEHLFILCAMVCSFLVTIEASIIKAVGGSVFLAHYQVANLPLAWLSILPLNILVVTLYNRYLPKIGCFKMLVSSIILAIGINIFSAFYLSKIELLPFFFYLWKDVFIMLMFQQVWSVFHSTIPSQRAKFLYGVFYGVGGLGSVLGSMIPGFFAVKMGSEKLLLLTIPFYVLLVAFYGWMLKVRNLHPHVEPIDFKEEKSSSFISGALAIVRSKSLIFIALIVVFMQVASTLLDYKFNFHVAINHPMQDLRTEYMGRFFGVVNGINVLLQFIGSFIVIHMMGVRRTHLLIPLYLGGCLLSLVYIPTFSLVALAYGSIKAIDYSIFGVAKEMLYIPLKISEKFQAKAVIDIFIYRTSKAFASVLVLVLQLISVALFQQMLSITLCVIFFFWIISVWTLYRPETVLSSSITEIN